MCDMISVFIVHGRLTAWREHLAKKSLMASRQVCV